METKFLIKTDIFEGPIELLFYLVEKEEVDIFNISLSKITQEFLLFLNSVKLDDLDKASEFLLIASSLIEIKSKRILPIYDDEKKEADETFDLQELLDKLIEYKKFKVMANALEEKQDQFSKVYFKEDKSFISPNEQIVLVDISLADLVSAFRQVLENTQKRTEIKDLIIDEKFSVQDKTNEIIELLKNGTSIDFNALFSPQPSRSEIVVSFLALLELMKRKIIRVLQDKFFGIIKIQSIG
jgi:segregation and condensation protein A